MKKTIALIIGMAFLTATTSFAGSEVSGKIVNKAEIKKSANIALGKNAKANMGSVKLKDSQQDQVQVTSAEPAVCGPDLDPVLVRQLRLRDVDNSHCLKTAFVKNPFSHDSA